MFMDTLQVLATALRFVRFLCFVNIAFSSFAKPQSPTGFVLFTYRHDRPVSKSFSIGHHVQVLVEALHSPSIYDSCMKTSVLLL